MLRLSWIVLALFAIAPAAYAAPDRTVVRHEMLGRSEEGRAIPVVEIGDPDESRKLLVVGCIHGDERAGIAIAAALERTPPLKNADLWIIEDLNPDGALAQTRVNGRGVDLNRNFPFRWRTLGRRGSPHYSGTHPLSEPESRLAARLILRTHPRITVWFHQPLNLVDESGGDTQLERRFASAVGLRLARLSRYPGSAASWENHVLSGTTAFVVELHAAALAPREVRRFVGAIRSLGAPDRDALASSAIRRRMSRRGSADQLRKVREVT